MSMYVKVVMLKFHKKHNYLCTAFPEISFLKKEISGNFDSHHVEKEENYKSLSKRSNKKKASDAYL